MKFITVCLSIAAISAMPLNSSNAADDYFYCGFTNINGTEQDYAKWGKGTDFKYNESAKRWEWISEYAYQYIYPDGKYEQKARVSYFDNKIGKCNSDMERIYKKKISELKEKYK